MVNAEEQEHSNMADKEQEATDLEKCWSQYISSLHTIENYYRCHEKKSCKESF